MSIHITRFVYCDSGRSDCPTGADVAIEDSTLSARNVRIEMRESGWKRRKGKDICPSCVAVDQDSSRR